MASLTCGEARALRAQVPGAEVLWTIARIYVPGRRTLKIAPFLQVWDHVLCNPPWFFPYVVLAYLLSTRVAFLRADSPATCAALSGRPHTLDVRRVLRRAAMALETTPADARLPEEPLRPLPPAPGAAAYAPFAGEFPPQALQAQRGERVRLLGQRTAIVERRRTLSELQVRRGSAEAAICGGESAWCNGRRQPRSNDTTVSATTPGAVSPCTFTQILYCSHLEAP